jgi:hypothetical protein
MYGELQVHTDGSSPVNQTVYMKYPMTRVELNLTIDSDDVVLDAARMLGVPERLELFGFSGTKTAPYPAPDQTRRILYDLMDDASRMPDYNGTRSKTLVWYLPPNVMGTSSQPNSDPRLKNDHAPKGSTFIEIYGHDSTTGGLVTYRFYPGANMTDDFNLLPNNNYRLNVTIKGKDDYVIDSRINDNEVVSYWGTPANCYILNPPKSGNTTFRIYPTQVDRFWGFDYANDPSNVLGSSVVWEVEVLWMDERGLVTRNGVLDTNIKLSKSQGVGVSDYFEVMVPKESKSGNFVVKIYKLGDPTKTALWSWHLWVTDYDPDVSNLTPIEKTYVYPVDGGAVHRYGLGIGHTNTSSNPWTYTNGTRYTGYLKDKGFIMDRNIGERTDYPVGLSRTSTNAPGLLYYQFGRKDPFPLGNNTASTAGKIWDIDGNVIVYNFVSNAITSPSGNGSGMGIRVGVMNPLRYIAVNVFDKTLPENTNANPNPSAYTYSIWMDNHLTHPGSSFYRFDTNTPVVLGKSLYDPCTAGWTVPTSYYVWYPSMYNSSNGVVVNSTNRQGIEPYLDGVYGTRYWPYDLINGSYPVLGRIIYPAAGYRYSTGSHLWSNSASNYTWTSYSYRYPENSVPSYDYGYFINMSSVSGQYSGNLDYGMPVRCITEYW